MAYQSENQRAYRTRKKLKENPEYKRKRSSKVKAEAGDIYREFLASLHLQGFKIDPNDISDLTKLGLIDDHKDYFAERDLAADIRKEKPKIKRFIATKFKTEEEAKADKSVIVLDVSESVPEEQRDKIIELIKEGADKAEQFIKSGAITFKADVKTSDWKVEKHQLFDHDKEFYNWINSINKGFQFRENYFRFELYKAQAKQWMSDKETILDYASEGDRDAYLEREIKRSDDNSMYWLEKYFHYKDSSSQTGFKPFITVEGIRVLCFLIDSGYSTFFAKARQIISTTTIFGIALKRTTIKKSYQVTIATADTTKAEKTFNEKVKEPYYAMSPLMRPGKPSTDTKLSISFFKNKKEQEAGGSLLSISTASAGLINSGSYDWFNIDEAGMIDCLSAMISEYEPTAIQYNHETGRLEQKSQLTIWGTSFLEKDGAVLDQSPDFEHQFRNALIQWDAKNFAGTLIPVFLNCYARPGVTPELYETFRKKAYDVVGVNAENTRIRFHKSFPVTIDDMFITNPNTLIPVMAINGHIKRINEATTENKCQYGYFEPVYSNDKIVSANFIVCDDPSDYRVSWCIYRHPAQHWINRYYKGTDPIANNSGHSKFASAIWDVVDTTITAAMNWRGATAQDCFLQSLLGLIYYDRRMPELIESNAGQGYFDFLRANGYEHIILPNMALPRQMQASGNPDGINNKTSTRGWIVQDLVKMLELHGENIWIYWVWLQLKTFVRSTTLNAGEFAYRVNDDRFNYDDILFASSFAFTCALSHEFQRPKNLMEVKVEHKKKSRLIMDKQTFSFRREFY